MYCSICKKAPATVHVTRIQNNQVFEQHFCNNCANSKSPSGLSTESNSSFNALHELLNQPGSSESSVDELLYTTTKICPRCGLSFDKFREIGKLGCPDCYHTFKEELSHLLRRMHGSSHHMGKNPQRTINLVERDKKIWGLRQKLQKAVKSENYEEAAKIRDLIDSEESNI